MDIEWCLAGGLGGWFVKVTDGGRSVADGKLLDYCWGLGGLFGLVDDDFVLFFFNS